MLSSDIICLQEFWFDPSYETIFRSALGDEYDFHTLKRTGGKSDGVAVLLRRGKWHMRSSMGMSLSPVGDRVALVMHLRSQDGGGASSGVEEDMILVNTHLAFPHTTFDRANQLSQIEMVTDSVEGFVRNAGLPTMTPRVVVGDLNVEETDPVCRHLGKSGFRSAFASLHREQRVITHRNHRGEEVSYCVGCVSVISFLLRGRFVVITFMAKNIFDAFVAWVGGRGGREAADRQKERCILHYVLYCSCLSSLTFFVPIIWGGKRKFQGRNCLF